MKFKTSYKLATLFLNKYSWKEIDAIPRRFFSHWICWKVGSSFWENTASQASYSTCILLLSIAQSMAFCCLNLSCTTGSRWMVINRERRLVKFKLHQLNLGLCLDFGLLWASFFFSLVFLLFQVTIASWPWGNYEVSVRTHHPNENYWKAKSSFPTGTLLIQVNQDIGLCSNR